MADGPEKGKVPWDTPSVTATSCQSLLASSTGEVLSPPQLSCFLGGFGAAIFGSDLQAVPNIF